MRIIVDDKIPFIRPALTQLANEVRYLPGSSITASDVKDADVLIVRTRTRCDRQLLQGSKVRFIATATIGFDHLDTDFLRSAGITWVNAPGCNASSVAQYVHSCLLLLARDCGLDLTHTTVGLIGVGHVGKAITEVLRPLGVRILLNDPPREHAEGKAAGPFHSLQTLQEQCDILSFHTPLVRQGQWPTFHLADEAFLHHLPGRPYLINTSRGEVVDNAALERALDEGIIRQAIIDTWENEPHIRLGLLQKAYLATPHIAGYSADGKANATRMVLQALCKWMGRPMNFDIQPPALPSSLHLSTHPDERALQLYDPTRDSLLLKASPESFERIRGDYPLRREFVASVPK